MSRDPAETHRDLLKLTQQLQIGYKPAFFRDIRRRQEQRTLNIRREIAESEPSKKIMALTDKVKKLNRQLRVPQTKEMREIIINNIKEAEEEFNVAFKDLKDLKDKKYPTVAMMTSAEMGLPMRQPATNELSREL